MIISTHVYNKLKFQNFISFIFHISEIETFKEWLRYRYGVFPETGFAGDSIYPNQYEFGGEMRDSIGCKEVATKMKKHSQSFKTEYGFETSPTGSHVTVPFLPNEETNDNRPHLKLEEFTSPSFKVGFTLLQRFRCIVCKSVNNTHSTK